MAQEETVCRLPNAWRYIQEYRPFKPWIIFGGHGDVADISDTDGDIIQNVPRSTAERILAARWEFLDEIEKILRDE